MANRKTVVLEDSVLAALAANSTFLREFPFLSMAKSKAVKSCCSQRGNRPDYNAVRALFAGLDSGRKKQLKHLLRADQVQLVYKDRKGGKLKQVF